MPAKRPRVAAYLPESLHEKFKQYTRENKLGDSQALIQVLSEYFGVAHQVAHGESLQVLERVERLESSLSAMRSDLLDELKRVVLAELAPQAVMFAIPPSHVEADPVLPDSEVIEAAKIDETSQILEPLSVADLVVSGEVTESQQSIIEADEICLSSVALEKRLNTSNSTMLRKKRSSFEVFAAWSAEKDPDGISWKVNDDGTVSPTGDIPPDIGEALKPQKLEGLNNGALAERLKIDRSTLSHWKRNKSPEEMLKAIREKDPDGIGWILNKETGRFIKEPGGSLRMTQGELPEILPQENDDF